MTPFLPEKTIFKYVISAMQLQEDGAGIGYRVSGKAGFGAHGILQKPKAKSQNAKCKMQKLKDGK